MKRTRILTAICGFAVAIAVIAIGVGGGVATGADNTQGAVVANLDVAPARAVNASAAPTGFAPSAPARAPLLRDGRPSGSELPTAPSTGTKSPATTSPASITPFVVTTNAFNGVTQAGSGCNCQPPDVSVTAGGPFIAEAVNLVYAVYDKTNGNVLLQVSLNNLFGTNDGLSHPRVTYDPTWNRWALVVEDTTAPRLWLAYSQTNDPTGFWWIYHVDFAFPAGSTVDFPNVGMDQNSFAYTSNNFGPSQNYLGSTAFDVPKPRSYNGFGFTAKSYGVNFNTTPAIVGGYPTEIGTFLYLLSPDSTKKVMDIYHFSGTGHTPFLSFDGTIPYDWTPPPRRVNQPGTSQTLDPLDGRIAAPAQQLGGRVWFAHGVALGSFPSVDYGYVTPGNMAIHVGTAHHSGTSDDFNPSISAQVSGGVAQAWVSWAYTDTPNGIPTRDVFDLNQGNTPNQVAGTVYSAPGAVTTESGFGDYSSSVPEYNAVGTCAQGLNAVVANEYFLADGTWGTRIARVHRSGC
jgi:hypothetical protein